MFICIEYTQVIQEASADNNQEFVRLRTQTAPILLPSCQQQQCTADVLGSFPQMGNSEGGDSVAAFLHQLFRVVQMTFIKFLHNSPRLLRKG